MSNIEVWNIKQSNRKRRKRAATVVLCVLALLGAPSLAGAAAPASASDDFAAADVELNAQWKALRARWKPEAFAELQANQRLWLRARDRYVADGDDRERNGPGTPSFERIRVERTRERVRFLEQLLRGIRSADGSGLYGDGLGRSVRLCAQDAPGGTAFFDLLADAPTWDMARGGHPPFLAGVGFPIQGRARAWSAESGSLRAAHGRAAPQELVLESADAPARLLLMSSADDEYTTTLYLLEAATPATAPMRELLRRLPARAFDHTEEGLEEAAKTRLLLAGEDESFVLLQQHPDRARLRYGVGEADVLRFAQADGSALLAIATRNVRVHTLDLWQLRNDGSSAALQPLAGWLPDLRAGQFFDRDAPAVPPDGGWVMRADPDALSLWIEWPPHAGAAAPTHRVELVWRGGRFEPHRRPLPENGL